MTALTAPPPLAAAAAASTPRTGAAGGLSVPNASASELDRPFPDPAAAATDAYFAELLEYR